MRAVFGLLLIMLGLAMAVVWMPEHHGERQLAVVTEIATKAIPRHSDAATANDATGRTFSPRTPLMATVEQPGRAQPNAQHTIAMARVAPQPPPPDQVAAARHPIPQHSAPAALLPASLPTAAAMDAPLTVAPVARPLEPTAPAWANAKTEMSREELVRNLQRELKRVGCYWGEVDGDWGTGSKRAMNQFTDRVNASLPIEQPDFILLALLRGHTGTACGKACPTGQSLSEGGRCVPNAVLARRSGDRRQFAAVTPDGQPQGATSDNVTIYSSAPVTSRIEPAPFAVATAVTAAEAAVSQTPLHGRMAVGAPPSHGSSYILNPQSPRTPARDAVRSASEDAAPAAAPARSSRARRAAPSRRGQAYAGASRYYYGAPAYRVPAPRNFAAAQPRRSSRAWTATFFGGTQ